MFKATSSFSGYAVSDITAAKKFYTETLGLALNDETMGLRFQLPGGGLLFIYEKRDHTPATFTILNFIVTNIDVAVDALATNGVSFERYENMPESQDEKGILRGRSSSQGPDIAWFKDPAGNILSVLQVN
jgi:catechol 2,3-dioxygenase-like lactoylglutathione lyase family enzyme